VWIGHIGTCTPSSSESRRIQLPLPLVSTRKYGLPPGGVTFSITTRPPWRISSTLSVFCTGMRTLGSSAPENGGGGKGSGRGSSCGGRAWANAPAETIARTIDDHRRIATFY
jgi:hypothetical protein